MSLNKVQLIGNVGKDITSCCGADWLKQLKNMFTKSISCILKEKSAHAHTTTRMG